MGNRLFGADEVSCWYNVCGVTNGYVVHESWLARDLTESSRLEPFKLGLAGCKNVGGPDGKSVCGDRMNVSFVNLP